MSDKQLEVEITGIHHDITDFARKYIEKKCAKLIDYIPKKRRGASFASVKITYADKGPDKYTCEIVLTLPEKQLVASAESTSPQAAVDLTENKLRAQIRRYKNEHKPGEERHSGFRGALKKVLRRK
jgi:ribosomal subunit interface protein